MRHNFPWSRSPSAVVISTRACFEAGIAVGLDGLQSAASAGRGKWSGWMGSAAQQSS